MYDLSLKEAELERAFNNKLAALGLPLEQSDEIEILRQAAVMFKNELGYVPSYQLVYGPKLGLRIEKTED